MIAALLTGALLALLLLVSARLLAGRWMTIRSSHVEYDFRSLTLGGLPMEEIYGPDAVRHPYPLSEPSDYPLFANTPTFADAPGDPWRMDARAMRHAWLYGTHLGSRDPLRFLKDVSM